MATIKALQNCPLFSGLAKGELKALANATTACNLSAGEMLFLEGDVADGFYIMLKGRARIFKSTADGRELNIRVVHDGEIFGEVAMFDGRQFPANCIAMEKSLILFCPRQAFLRLLAKSPEVGLKLVGTLCRHLRILNQLVENLALKDVPQRLAASILEKSDSAGGESFTLDMSKSEWARRLGTVIETLSRNLRKLKAAGIISVEKKSIKIRNRKLLEAIASGERLNNLT